MNVDFKVEGNCVKFDQGRKLCFHNISRFHEALEHAKKLGEKAVYQFLSTLRDMAWYGNGEGGIWDRNLGRDTYTVLYPDFAPYSFRFIRNCLENDVWREQCVGGLIYQGPECPADGSSPSFTVNLNGEVGWFCHT